MKFCIMLIVTLIGSVIGAPQKGGPVTDPIPIIKQEQEVNFDESYKRLNETGNGLTAEEQYIRNLIARKDASVRVQFSVTASDGQVKNVTFISDENGFHLQGDHLPESSNVTYRHETDYRLYIAFPKGES